MVKEKPATGVAHTVKRKLHMEGKKIKPSILDFASNSMIVIDVRPGTDYHKYHIRHALNLPAKEWSQSSEEELCVHLQNIYFPELINNLYSSSVHHEHLGRLSKMKESIGMAVDSHLIVIYHNNTKEQALIELEAITSLLKSVSKDISNITTSLTEQNIKTFKNFCSKLFPSAHFADIEIFQLKKGIEELNVKKYQETFYSAQKEEGCGWKQSTCNIERHKTKKEPSIYSVIPGVLFYGEVSEYYNYVKGQSEKSEKELFEEKRTNSIQESWNVVEEIFDLRENPSIPNHILKNADISQSYGTRVVTEVTTKETTIKSKTKGFLRRKVKHETATVTEQTREYVEDENVTQTVYRFSNGFSFTVNCASALEGIETSLFSLLHCIEGCTLAQKPILIQPTRYSLAIVLGYLVHLRKWSLRRAFKFVFKRLPRKLVTQHSETLIEPVRLYLEYERVTLPHIYPSIPFRIIVLFHLNMEPNLDSNLKKCKNHEITDIEKKLFIAIDEGDVDYVTNLLRITQAFDLSRTSLKDNDQTPLIVALKSYNTNVRTDPNCFELLTRIESVQLSTIDGRDALYYAIEAGEYFVRELVRKGAIVNTSSMRLKMNPLQRAIKYQVTEETLKLLTNEETVNHRDLYQRTPCHYAIESYPDSKLQSIITMFLEQGANLFLVDVDGNTPTQYATIKQKSASTCKFLTKMANKEGTIRYDPHQSYAPPRENININYYIDGENYFAALAKALRTAQRCVYIAGWWLTPEIFLERSGDNYSEWKENRLDNIIKEIADRGVQVRILLWENFEQAEDIKNDLAIKKLEELSPNVKGMVHTSSFIAGYTHHQKIVAIDEYDAFVGGLDLCLHRWDQQSHSIYPSFLYVGKDYFNSRFLGDPTHSDNSVALPKRDYYGLADRNIPRSGWHDIHMRVDGLAAADTCRNFVQRWNWARKGNSKYLPLELPSFEGIFSDTPKEGAFQATVQLTRSISHWAVGFDLKESSIINAIKDSITKAESFVYIETQFFISVQGDSSITNIDTGEPESLADVIINRIRKAQRNEKNFKVIIILPMFPEGNPLDYVTQRIMYWQLKTIEYIQTEVDKMCRGLPLDSTDYIRFYSLGNHGFIDNKVVAEQIYIHAKLLITDTTVVCGSANLNMRSLAGDRDSEIAVVATSRELSLAMRKELWREHLGPDAKITDVFLDDVHLWEEIARDNSRIYRKLFEGSCPLGGPRTKDHFLTAEKIFTGLWSTVDSRRTYETLKTMVRGHLVKFPQHFLADDIRNTEKIKAHPLSMFSPNMISQFKEGIVVNIKEDIVQ